ncbi:MAG: formate/nitrite transporter family protein [Romboutsia sp.]
MDKRFLTPDEVAKATVNVGIKKAGLSKVSCIYLGIFAGIYIAFGGLANILVAQTLGSIDVGLAKFMGASVFPVGLMLVVICGGELFTGNNLMTLAIFDKKITLMELLRNWTLVWIANLIGSLLLVLAVYYGNVINGDALAKIVSTAEAKCGLDISVMFFRAILCNMLVVLAVWMATASQDIISKIFSCWFPVMIFVLCGFEHSVANMFFIPMGMILGADVTIAQCIINLVVVTIGNIVGGAIIVPFVYKRCYLNNKDNNIKA